MSSEAANNTIVVAVCARSDSLTLRELVGSLFSQETPSGWAHPEILVVVNESEALSPRLGEYLETVTPPGRVSQVIFEVVKGIPHSRNAALDWANKHELGWVGFIDDDCRPEDDWLYELCRAQEITGADAVAGAWNVVPVEEPSRWLPPYFWGPQRYEVAGKPATDLARLETAYTRSVLVCSASAVDSVGKALRFNPARETRGGSDVEFFDDFAAAGNMIVFAEKSRVKELYGNERLSFRWHFKRKIRNSQRVLENEVMRFNPRFRYRLRGYGKSLREALLLVILPINSPRTEYTTRQRAAELALQLAPLVGVLAEFLGFRYHSYSDSWKFLR
jgi:glycosyltransferase involved in cell wall biosynthesis